MVRPLSLLELSWCYQSLIVVIFKIEYIKQHKDVNVSKSLIGGNPLHWDNCRAANRIEVHRSELIDRKLISKALSKLITKLNIYSLLELIKKVYSIREIVHFLGLLIFDQSESLLGQAFLFGKIGQLSIEDYLRGPFLQLLNKVSIEYQIIRA